MHSKSSSSDEERREEKGVGEEGEGEGEREGEREDSSLIRRQGTQGKGAEVFSDEKYCWKKKMKSERSLLKIFWCNKPYY